MQGTHVDAHSHTHRHANIQMCASKFTLGSWSEDQGLHVVTGPRHMQSTRVRKLPPLKVWLAPSSHTDTRIRNTHISTQAYTQTCAHAKNKHTRPASHPPNHTLTHKTNKCVQAHILQPLAWQLTTGMEVLRWYFQGPGVQ